MFYQHLCQTSKPQGKQLRLFVYVPGLKSSVGQKPAEDGGITLILSLTVLTLLLTSLLCCMEFSILAQKASWETQGQLVGPGKSPLGLRGCSKGGQYTVSTEVKLRFYRWLYIFW